MFLKCLPAVYVVEGEYEISISLKEKGVCWIDINGVEYYEDSAGVFSSEKTYIKIRVPQKTLNKAKNYEVKYRKTIDRKAYFSELGDIERIKFNFKPIEKEDNIHIYHIADVHYKFNEAVSVASYWGDETDLFIVNGDIGEVETEQNYFEVCKFVGEISKGEIPVLFVRGNHDTRGKLAERFTDYFPSVRNKTYFEFSVGPIVGVALDCGEDKADINIEYGGNPQLNLKGTNFFRRFRENETEFLKNLRLKGKIKFAVSHVCPAHTTKNKGDVFCIDNDLYSQWCESLEKLGVKFMICGHMHDAYVLEPHSESLTVDCNFHTVFASVHREKLMGGAITVKGNDIEVLITDENHEVRDRFYLQGVI